MCFQSLVRAQCLYHQTVDHVIGTSPVRFQSLVRAQCLYHIYGELDALFPFETFNRSFALSASTTGARAHAACGD